MPDETRKPLVHREQTAEEKARFTPDNFPRTSNPLELEAQEKIRMENTTPAPVPAKPLVPKALVALAATLVPTLFTAAQLLPPPYGPIALGVLFVVAALLGIALPVPKVLAGKALVAVPALGTVAVGVFQFAQTLPDGKLKAGLIGGSVVFAGLAGVALDQPKKEEIGKTLLVLLITAGLALPTFALAEDVISGGGTIVSAGASTDNTTTAVPFTLVSGNTYCAQATGDGYILVSTAAATAATSSNGIFIPQNNYPCYPIKLTGDYKYVSFIPASGAANLKIFLTRW